MNNPYGDFLYDQKEFCINERDIPRNWYNYLWNHDVVSFVSQAGVGRATLQDRMGKQFHFLTERGMYLLEEDAHWGLIGMPVDEKIDHYACIHGLGYTKFITENREIRAEVRYFVPRHDHCEVSHITLWNRSDRVRTLRLLSYTGHELDGTYTPQGYNTGHADFDPACGGILCEGLRSSFGGQKNVSYYGYTVITPAPSGYDAARNAFVGVYDSLALPKAVKRGGCTNTAGTGEKLAAALQNDITLQPGESADLFLLCGVAFSKEELLETKEKFGCAADCRQELEAVKAAFRQTNDRVGIETPDRQLNELFHWLKHETVMGSRWARVRSNGYRDILQDTECLAAVDPQLALSRLERILSFQYSNGFAPRSIKEGKIRDDNFSDNCVWITFTASAILKELGDVSILDRQIPFNDGSSATLYEHIRRSVDFLYHFRGLHGLIKIWGGDWNDCMNTAGLEGKGVSVWLSLAWLRASNMFAEIARIYGNEADAALAEERSREMEAIIEQYGWDGEYYLDAYNDHEEKIGSHENEEGRIYLIPQLWSVLSDIGDGKRQSEAMDAVEKYLANPLGIRICDPPYTKNDPNIGVMTTKFPGIHENGGVYLHTIAWKIAADAMLKRADKVAQGIETMLPFRNKIVNGRAEPYILCNSYFGVQTGYRYGTPGQSWRSASSPWFMMALVKYVFGLQPEMTGLRIDPCLPPSWEKAEITKLFRGTQYHIRYENHGPRVKQILVDGKPIAGTVIPVSGKDICKVTVVTG